MKMIMLCTHHLNSQFKVGSHHIYQYLKDYKTSELKYYSAAITPFHVLNLNQDTLLRIKKSIVKSGDEIVPFSLIAPHNKYPFNHSFTLNKWVKFSNLNKKKTDILYIDNIFYTPYINFINYKKLIFRMNDYYPNLPNWNGNTLNSLLSILFEKSDTILYSAKELYQYVPEDLKQKSIYLPNGVELINKYPILNDIGIPRNKPLIVYSGSVDKWFDKILMQQIAERLPEFNFVIIGSNSNFKSTQNIFELGLVEYYKARSIINICDVGVIPFRIDKYKSLIDSINPLKLYEYMASGLSVVSTKWAEIININSPAYLANDVNEFIEMIKIAYSRKQHMEAKNIEYATKFNWNSILNNTLNSELLNTEIA